MRPQPIKTTWDRLGNTLMLIPIYEYSDPEMAQRIDAEVFRLEKLNRERPITDSDIEYLLSVWPNTQQQYKVLQKILRTIKVKTVTLESLTKKLFIEALSR